MLSQPEMLDEHKWVILSLHSLHTTFWKSWLLLLCDFFFSIILFSTRVSEELEVKMTGSLSDLFRYSPLTILLLFLRISHTIFSKFLILPSRSINAFLKTSCQRILCYLDFICKNDLNSVTKIQSKCKVFLLCDLTIKSDKNCRN